MSSGPPQCWGPSCPQPTGPAQAGAVHHSKLHPLTSSRAAHSPACLPVPRTVRAPPMRALCRWPHAPDVHSRTPVPEGPGALQGGEPTPPATTISSSLRPQLQAISHSGRGPSALVPEGSVELSQGHLGAPWSDPAPAAGVGLGVSLLPTPTPRRPDRGSLQSDHQQRRPPGAALGSASQHRPFIQSLGSLPTSRGQA